MRKRFSGILLFLAIILMLGLVSGSSHYVFNDFTVTYDKDSQIYVECDASSGSCPVGAFTNPKIKVCGEKVGTRTVDPSSWSGSNYKFELITSFGSSTTEVVPQKFPCGIGENSPIKFYDGNNFLAEGGELNVVTDSIIDDHVAPKMVVGLNTGGTVCSGNNIREFYLSDYNPTGGSPASPSMLLVEHNCAGPNFGQAESDIGHILEPSEGEKLDAIVQTCPSYSSAPCHIKDEAFDTSYGTKYGSAACYSGGSCDPGDSISPLHDGGNGWYPDGEIAVGRYPDYFYKDSAGVVQPGPANAHDNVTGYYFVCREGADMVTAKALGPSPVQTTSQVADLQLPGYSGEHLVKCDQNTGEWYQVEECEDGIDNDGDGRIDYGDDPGCNSNTDTEDGGTGPCPGPDPCTPPPSCKIGVTTEEVYNPIGSGTFETLVAQYEDVDGNCNTDSAPFSWGDPDLAHEIDNNNDAQLHYCDNDSTTLDPMPCYRKNLDHDGFGHNIMPVAEYYGSYSYFRDIEKARDSVDFSDPDYVFDTPFVSNITGWDYKVQTLYDAEKKYGGISGACLNGSTWPESVSCKYYGTWASKNVSEPEATQAYDDNYDASNNLIAWKGPYNAGANNENVSSSLSTPPNEEKPVFDGGFVAECPTGKVWEYKDTESEWKCGDGLDWKQTVMLTRMDNNDAAGIIFPPYNFKSDTGDYPDFLWNYSSTLDINYGLGWKGFEKAFDDAPHLSGFSNELTELNARCWAGSSTDEPDDFSQYYEPGNVTNVTSKMTVDLTGLPNNPDYPIGVVENLSYSSSEGYSCTWNFTAANSIQGKSHLVEAGSQFDIHAGQNSPYITPSSRSEWISWNFSNNPDYGRFSNPSNLPGLRVNQGYDYDKQKLEDQIDYWHSQNGIP